MGMSAEEVKLQEGQPAAPAPVQDEVTTHFVHAHGVGQDLKSVFHKINDHMHEEPELQMQLLTHINEVFKLLKTRYAALKLEDYIK